MQKKSGKRGIRRSSSDLAFDAFNMVFMVAFLFVMFYPLYFTIIASFSDIREVGAGNVYLYPKGFSLDAYSNVFINKQIWSGYRNSILYTAGGVVYNLIIMLPAAYVLAQKNLFGRNVVTWFFLFTMYFSGGIIPSYLLMKNLNLINHPLVLILGSIGVYQMVVTRTYFSSNIPLEIYESAHIDGAGEFTCFFRIALPLAKPILAVMALQFGVGMWNSYFKAMLYMANRSLYPLQLVLRGILIQNEQMVMDPEFFASLSGDEQLVLAQRANLAQSMKFAVIFIASAPLLIAYPFAQKYFVQGIMIGSLKG